MNYTYLFEYICERFRLSATDVIELHYSLPGCPLSFLHNDNDFQMLFIGAKIYNLDCVEIIVEKNSERCRKRTSVSCEDSCSEVLDEDDYLTEGYRSEVSKPYLSREWDGCFYIDSLNNVHTCKGVLRQKKHVRLGSKVVKTCIQEDISYNMSLKPRDIQIKMQSAYGFEISYKVAWKAKQSARDMIYGSEAESFNMLSWFRETVLASFKFCLPVLYVDGTFGKSLYKGTILCETGRTGNKGCFPLAMCVCDSETEDNWCFFFRHLKDLLESQGRVVTFMSDRGNGLLGSFSKVLPGHPHLFCYMHLSANLMNRYGGVSATVKNSVKNKFFELAYASSPTQYRLHLRKLREIGDAKIIDDFLKDMPLENWCRAFFPGSRYGIMTNSMAESFNAWFAEER
ncbi:PREDICTED: uncharacterized protein LOC101306805 [Fragaria vesca subsp. vesca]